MLDSLVHYILLYFITYRKSAHLQQTFDYALNAHSRPKVGLGLLDGSPILCFKSMVSLRSDNHLFAFRSKLSMDWFASGPLHGRGCFIKTFLWLGLPSSLSEPLSALLSLSWSSASDIDSSNDMYSSFIMDFIFSLSSGISKVEMSAALDLDFRS